MDLYNFFDFVEIEIFVIVETTLAVIFRDLFKIQVIYRTFLKQPTYIAFRIA